MVKRLLDTTDVFQLLWLFHKQWRNKPAVAIASLIINAYKRRSVLTAQDADVALTTVGVAYLRFKKHVKSDTCALYPHHSTFAHGK